MLPKSIDLKVQTILSENISRDSRLCKLKILLSQYQDYFKSTGIDYTRVASKLLIEYETKRTKYK